MREHLINIFAFLSNSPIEGASLTTYQIKDSLERKELLSHLKEKSNLMVNQGRKEKLNERRGAKLKLKYLSFSEKLLNIRWLMKMQIMFGIMERLYRFLMMMNLMMRVNLRWNMMVMIKVMKYR